MKKISGAQVFIESLRCEGVKHVFGFPGGAVLDIFDAIMGATDIDFILTRHEQGALTVRRHNNTYDQQDHYCNSADNQYPSHKNVLNLSN